MLSRLFLSLTFFVGLSVHPVLSAEEFALRDGDTVAFLGDSITAARGYSKIVENYTLLRFPDRKIRFMNVARGGETAQGSLERLESAVLDRGVTVLTVAYGINDIGWGTKADDAHETAFLESIGKIITRCQAKGIRVFICSAAITDEAPEKAEVGFLQKMCDKGLGVAKAKGAGTIDLMRSMRQVQRRMLAGNASSNEKERLHTPDGVHLNDVGQMAMAWALLKGLGAPADSSLAAVDAKDASVIAQQSCSLSQVEKTANGVNFTRLDKGLPFNLHPLWGLMGRYIPFSEELNRYMVRIANLETGTYEITADGRLLGSWNEQQLAAGVNIASASGMNWEPGGLWQAQGQVTDALVTVRDGLDHMANSNDTFFKMHPAQSSILEKARAVEASIIALQREIARPVPIRFAVLKK